MKPTNCSGPPVIVAGSTFATIEPAKPYAQHIDYMDKMPAMQDWRRFAAAGNLVGGQSNWFAAVKPIEELYDTENDPWELNNLGHFAAVCRPAGSNAAGHGAVATGSR